MELKIKTYKKLYYLEYTDAALLFLAEPFQLVGFDCKGNWWNPSNPNRLLEYVWPDLESWQPDVIFWRSRIAYDPHLPEEPDEWISVCKRLREHPILTNSKIMAIFSSFQKVTSNQQNEWSRWYDFQDRGPLRVVKHAKVAKQLVGQAINGFEGVNDYLVKKNGTWKISVEIMDERANQKELKPDAEGHFMKPPLTQLLITNNQGEIAWIKNGIQEEKPTFIVYVVKALRDWQEGLSPKEVDRLVGLTSLAKPNHQLLIGANLSLLEAGPKVVHQVLKQAQNAGGWQVFINEHMWFERFRTSRHPEPPDETFERIVYQGVEAINERWDIIAM